MPRGRDFFKEDLLKEIHVHQFYDTPKLSRSVGIYMGMKFTVSCVLTQQMLQTKFGEDWTSSSWEEDVYLNHTKAYTLINYKS